MSSSERYIKPLVKESTAYVDGIIASQRGKDWVAGNVNIADRIFTKDMTVTILGDGVFKITATEYDKILSPAQAAFLKMFQPVSEVDGVKATIDGVEYSGKNEILFNKGNITVDGNPVTPTYKM
ncbi:hypothetical protein [Legionella sp. CNM-4043-24]|uniref:hypothetical protein n=1 Tax=Legionella sp. CNM-4043-24 TaxID=3421646 RepID=UPI00403B02F8